MIQKRIFFHLFGFEPSMISTTGNLDPKDRAMLVRMAEEVHIQASGCDMEQDGNEHNTNIYIQNIY